MLSELLCDLRFTLYWREQGYRPRTRIPRTGLIRATRQPLHAFVLVLGLALAMPAQQAQDSGSDAAKEVSRDDSAASEVVGLEEGEATEGGTSDQRTSLNLLGQEDTKSGEARRNENVQFNLVDTNTLQELNIRLGATATIVTDFQPDRDYYGAEYGRRAPPNLHLPPARGSGVHGNLSWTHGNSVFSARSFFQVGDVQPANENRYGFRLTAPVSSRTRFTVNATQQKIRGQVNGNVLVPLPEERTPLLVDPSTGERTDPETRAIVEQLLAAYPTVLPNRTDIAPRALNTNAPQRVDTDSANLRLDHDLGAMGRLGMGYVFTSQSVDAFQFVRGQNPDTEIKNHRPRVTWTRTLSPQTVTNFSIGYDRVSSLLIPEPNNFGPTVGVGRAIDNQGPSPLIPVDRAINRFRGAGQIARTVGNHSIKAGFHLGRIQLNGVEQQAIRGNTQFSNNFGNDAITNFRLGKPTRLLKTVGSFHRGFRQWSNQFYVADTWKVLPSLTLSMGLRYELVTPPQEVNEFEILPYGCDCNNFAPRFGFAYNLGNGLGTLRGAYGISYGEIYPVTYSQYRINAPNVVRLVVLQPRLVDIISGAAFANVTPGSRSTLFDIADNLVEPYSHQYSMSWEFALSRTMNLQVGYVGSRTHKVFQAWFLNRGERPDGLPVTVRTTNRRRGDARYNDVLRLHNASRAYFDAGRVAFAMRNLKGFTIDAAYWFSKSIDLGSDYTNTMNGGDARRAVSQTAYNIHSDVKSLSFFDQPHSLLMRAVYETPAGSGWSGRLFGGWQFSTVSLVKTGTPFTVQTGSDGPGFGNVDGAMGDRPHLLDTSILGRTVGDPDTSRQILRREAFAFQRVGDLAGTLGLRTFRRGKIANVNASLSRSWSVASEKKLTFRAESVNFFNTPQFADPNTSLTSPAFGRITNTLNDGRTFRFSIVLDF